MSFRLRDHNKVLAEGGATKKKAHHKKIPELTDAQAVGVYPPPGPPWLVVCGRGPSP
jgi:hypothetical protein